MPYYPTNIRYLLALNEYQFLTTAQFSRLGYGTPRNVYKRLLTLRTGPRAVLARYGDYKLPRQGKYPRRLHDLYYMTQAGAKCLEEFFGLNDDDIAYRKARTPPVNQYFHHVNTIDFQIETKAFCEQQGFDVRFFHTYMDRTGSNRTSPRHARLKSETRLSLGRNGQGKEIVFVPDAIFFADSIGAYSDFYAVEVYNGFATARVIRQLRQHLDALQSLALSKAYNIPNAWRVLVVFDQEAELQAVIKRAARELQFDDERRFFMFNSLDRIKQNYNEGWFHMDRSTGSAFVRRVQK